MTTQKNELSKIIEGILFSASAPLSAENLAKYFEEEERPPLGLLREIIAEIQAQYSERGIQLIEVASGFRFQVAQDVAPLIAKTTDDKPSRYSRALLETLALIAYRQPITRSEIEDIRGVAVSTHIIKTLDEHEWIRVVGHKEVPGRPALYATTKTFLDHFGLKSLDELPPLAELRPIQPLEDLETSAIVNEEETVEENIEEEVVA